MRTCADANSHPHAPRPAYGSGMTSGLAGSGMTAGLAGSGMTAGLAGSGMTAGLAGSGMTAGLAGSGMTAGLAGSGMTAGLAGSGMTSGSMPSSSSPSSGSDSLAFSWYRSSSSSMLASSSATATFPMTVLSLTWPRSQKDEYGGRRAASYRARRPTLEGISGKPGGLQLGAYLCRLSAVTEFVEDPGGPSPRFTRFRCQAVASLGPAEELQRNRLVLPVARHLVAGQRLTKMIQSVRVPSQRQVATPETAQGVSSTIHRFDLGECAPGLLQVVEGLVGAIKV